LRPARGTVGEIYMQSRILVFAIGAVLAGAAAQAQQADSSAADPLEEVIVLGRGETRQVQSITAQQIEYLPPGTSPLKAIEKLPGVNFQSTDPYGAYEWSTRITVRGFNQNRIGFTLDGVPLGDMTYGNHNGLHISRAIPTELVGRAVLSQGTGSIDTPSLSNLGGAVEFFSANPESEVGATVAQTFGSDSARRTFARFDSGELGTGTRAYVAVADSSTDKWKGNGTQETRMYTLKAVQPVGDGTLTGYYDYSDRAEIDYQDLSKDIVTRRGPDWDNFFPNWDGAIAAANACAAAKFNDAVICDDAYWNASGLRKDHLGYVALDLPLGETMQWQTTAYGHGNRGQGLWGTPYTPTPGGAPLSVRSTEYYLKRFGVVTGLTWTSGAHEVNGGVWYETNDFTQARRFYGEPSSAGPTRDFTELLSNSFQTDWEYDFDTESYVFHLQDTWSVSDKLRLNFGFRSVHAENTAKTVAAINATLVKNGTIEADEPFLPQVGFNWSISDDMEWFGSVARNVRAFASSGTSGPFSTTAIGFEAIRDVLEPETANNYETGLRFRGAAFEALFAVYHVDFKDRLVGINTGPGILGNPSVLANVGSVTTNGAEAALTWRPMTSLTWFTSLSWNDSEYDDNYTTGGTRVVAVKGKQVTDTPEILLKSELTYDNGAFFASANVNYTDERFYTYLNQGSVDAYTLVNLTAGYRFRGFGAFEQLSIQLDATNVTDKEYFSTIDSNGFTEADPNGTWNSLLLGAPRQFFLSAKAKF
jgi:iron complex outermembrane receptor protein